MKQNKLVYYMYEVYKLLIIKYVFTKNDSSTRTSIDVRRTWKYGKPEMITGAGVSVHPLHCFT